MATLDVIVGSWDEISEQTQMLADRQVRVIVLPRSAQGRADIRLPQEETERLLDDLADIGTDAPAWPEECCTRDTADSDSDSDKDSG